MEGRQDAFELLIRRHYEGCRRFAERMLHDEADAEDAVQDTFMRAYLAQGRFDASLPFRAWLFRILINCCRTYALQRSRRERRFGPYEDALLLVVVPPTDAQPDVTRIRQAVDALDPLLREAFLLKYVEDMDYQEMSAALGARVSALKMRVKRACDALRPRLKELYDG